MYKYITDILRVVKKNELRQFLPMMLLIFFILLNYSFIHSIKDSLIVPNIGAEAASFIEMWVVLPSLFIFALFYLKLSVLIPDKEKLFYIVCVFFLAFFIIFAFCLYPGFDFISSRHDYYQQLTLYSPRLKWFIIIYKNWPLALFNIFSELWINTMLSLLFWQHANSIIPTEQARRFYPLFSLAGNFSLIVGGVILKKVSIHASSEIVIEHLTGLIVIIGIICMALFRVSVNSIKSSHSFPPSCLIANNSLSFQESLKLVLSSRYLWLISITIISYGITISLSYGLWKSQVLRLYPSTHEYILFTAEYQKWVGIASSVIMLFGSVIVRKLSWRCAAMVTPLVMLLTGTVFFCWVVLGSCMNKFISEYLYIVLAVIIGTAHIVCTKSANFSVFNPTKELAYIPLEANLRDKGKVAVDLISERFGKSIGALLQSLLFMVKPDATFAIFAPLFLVISVLVLGCWLVAINFLNKKYLYYSASHRD